MVSIPVIAHFAAATFFGNVAFSAMGFGMAICYLFVYQIGALAGLTDCCGLPGLKYAVFIQTIGMAVIQPIVLWNVGLKKNFRLEIMLTMLPMQFIGAPFGQYLQVYTPSEVLKIIVGVVTIGVAGWQIFSLIKIMLAARSSRYEMVEVTVDKQAEGDEVNDKDDGTPNPKVEGVKKMEEQLTIVDPNDWEGREKLSMVLEKFTAANGMIPLVTENGVEHTKREVGLAELHMQEIMQTGHSQETDLKHQIKTAYRQIKRELWPIRPVIIWMSLAGLVSGFLGGLIGVRSPPLIIFFFFYEYPPLQVKANGAVIATANTLVRIIMYVTNPPPASYGTSTWFVMDDIWLYVTVALIAITASPIGLYFTRYLNKKGYKMALTLLLIVNGVTMITTATLALATGNIEQR